MVGVGFLRHLIRRSSRRERLHEHIGIAGSLLLLRSLGTLLFGVTPYDVPTYAIVIVLLSIISGVASYCPRHAARIEPLTALRPE